MKHTLLAVLLFILPAAAEPVLVRPQTTPAEAITAASPMRLSEADEVLAASSELIKSSVDLRADGSARTTHRIGTFETRIELQGLAVREIVKSALTEEDHRNGVTRRYIAQLHCTAHRLWDGPMASWSEWRDSSYGFFPSSVIVEEIDGSMRARANRITDFSPGIDASMVAAR